jgi:phenylacetate-CoA ligase
MATEKMEPPIMLNKVTKAFTLWNKFRFLKRSRLEIEALQSRKLRTLVAHAYATVPYWRDFFDKHHLKPADILSVKDMHKIPLTSKKDLVGLDRNQITSTHFDPKALTPIKTSGSTGEPFVFFADPGYLRIVSLDTLRSKIRHGLRPRNRMLRIGGDQTDLKRPANPFEQMFFHTALLSSFTAPEEILPVYERFKPHVVWSFISILYSFSLWLETRRIRLSWKPRFLLCSAEMVHDFMRRKVEDTFGAKIVDRYSTTELGVVADECQTHGGYHLYEDSIIAEIVEIGGLPHFVGTNLDNYATPFIRYNTRDVCQPWPEMTSVCGCGLTTNKIQTICGRDNDFLKSPDGQIIAPTRLIYLMRESYHVVRKFRFVQNSPETVRVTLTMKSKGAPVDFADLAENIRRVTGGLAADIHLADDIAPDPSGKMRIIHYSAGEPE